MNFGQLKRVIHEYINRINKASNAEKNNAARFRIVNYLRVIDALDSLYDDHIKVSKAKLDAIPLTDHMHAKLLEFTEAAPKKYSSDLLAELAAIKGIGPSRAQELIDRGLTRVSQLKLKKWQSSLTNETKLFLSLKPMDKIPHEEIKRLEPRITRCASHVKLVGSYRRGKSHSRDIDVMVVDKNLYALENFLSRLSKEFGTSNVIPYASGPDKMSCVIIVENARYKLDAFRVEPGHRVASMLLYSTGSKAHNIAMRTRAKRMGYLLNQNGLFLIKNKKMILVEGLRTEADYFRALGMPYVAPNLR